MKGKRGKAATQCKSRPSGARDRSRGKRNAQRPTSNVQLRIRKRISGAFGELLRGAAGAGGGRLPPGCDKAAGQRDVRLRNVRRSHWNAGHPMAAIAGENDLREGDRAAAEQSGAAGAKEMPAELALPCLLAALDLSITTAVLPAHPNGGRKAEGPIRPEPFQNRVITGNFPKSGGALSILRIKYGPRGRNPNRVSGFSRVAAFLAERRSVL